MNNCCSQQTKENRLPIALEHVHQMCFLFQIIVVKKHLFCYIPNIFNYNIYREIYNIFNAFIRIY